MVFSVAALELYGRACRRGQWHRFWAWVHNRPAQLFDLTTLLAGSTVTGRRGLGRQPVPIAQICGSEGRWNLFDDAFHPRDTYTRTRWLSVATAWLRGVALPPVELIRLGDRYVVRDGHHRISVVSALGVPEIDAVVTAWTLAPTYRQP